MVSSRAIWIEGSAATATNAVTVEPIAFATIVGAWSCSARNAVWISTVRSSTRRWRPPRRKAAAIFERDSPRPRVGVGAIANTANASPEANESKAFRTPG